MIEGSDVVGALPHVIERNARGLGILIKQQVGERGLRSLNVRGQNRLLSDVRIEVEIQVRETGEAPPKAVNLILDIGARAPLEAHSLYRCTELKILLSQVFAIHLASP